MLFLLAYSLFLRININQQLLRKDFRHNLTKGLQVCFDESRRCHFSRNRSDIITSKAANHSEAGNLTEEEEEGDIGKDEKDRETENCSISQAIETICHPDLVYSEDTSNIVLRCLTTFFCLFFAVKAFWLFREWEILKRRGYQYPRVLTLVTLAISIAFTSVACYVDRQDISYKTGPPFISCSLGILEIFILLSSAWLLGNLCLKMHFNRVFKDKVVIPYFKDPEIMFQWVTLVPAIMAVILKNSLMASTSTGDFFSEYLTGITALSIATATAVVVIKIGHSDNTTFGNFATMFHIILKKIPYYYLAILYLLHGFSFGFWILENKAASENDERSFNDYWRSGIEVLMMCFGLTEFDFGGPFKYAGLKFSSGSSVTVVFSYILLTLMVLLVMLGLLNLLLTTLIKDHKETKDEVSLNSIIFMARYAIYLEDCHGFWNTYCWLIAQIIHYGQNTLDESKETKTARFCTRSYCPSEMMEAEDEKEKVIKHISPHFDWVVEKLIRIAKVENTDRCTQTEDE